MTIEIKAPAFPESVADGVVSAWHKKPGDSVARDELLVEIETDKVVMEVVAPEPGVIEAILVPEGETIASEALLATLVAGAVTSVDSQPEDGGSTGREHAAAEVVEETLSSAGAVPMGDESNDEYQEAQSGTQSGDCSKEEPETGGAGPRAGAGAAHQAAQESKEKGRRAEQCRPEED